MKSNLLHMLFLLVALSTYSLVSGVASPDAVRDTNGDIVRAGVRYNIVPVSYGLGGGLTLRSIRNDSCPMDVVQEALDVFNGKPLTFTMVDPKKGVIRESTDLNIEFNGAITICIESLVWKLDNYDGEYVVSTRGVKGNPGVETLDSWFKIEKYSDLDSDSGDYKLVFCPTVCDFCKPVCGDIGISVKDNGVRRLVLSNKAFRVRFRKV